MIRRLWLKEALRAAQAYWHSQAEGALEAAEAMTVVNADDEANKHLARYEECLKYGSQATQKFREWPFPSPEDLDKRRADLSWLKPTNVKDVRAFRWPREDGAMLRIADDSRLVDVCEVGDYVVYDTSCEGCSLRLMSSEEFERQYQLSDSATSTPKNPEPGLFQTRPVVVKAVRWFRVGDAENVVLFPRGTGGCICCGKPQSDHGWVTTVERVICPGDWIVTKADGELQICTPGDFRRLYEPRIQVSGEDRDREIWWP